MGKYAATLPAAIKNNFDAELKRLKDEAFQELLASYQRKPKLFISAIENQDTVTSEYLPRDGAGKEYKPADYLELFAAFVKANANQVEAIRILLDKPKEWGTVALTELRNKLATTPQKFTVENLQNAHKLRYNKALVDIISMVKHAANADEQLLTAAERVSRALAKLTADKSFTADQSKWLERIREHLVANLSIDKTDFDEVPVLSDAGGWGRANKVFDGNLGDLLAAMNEALAA